MMTMLRQEINGWQFKKSLCEANALNGIKQLMQLNSSHPIQEVTSLIYFIDKQGNSTEDTLFFGSKKVRWFYHCCIGLKDIYLNEDWFIDLSYHCMSGYDERIIPKKQYLTHIPCTVDAFVIPLTNLRYFINQFRFRLRISAKKYLDMTNLLFVLDPLYAYPSDAVKINSMLNRSIILKFETMTKFCLPLGIRLNLCGRRRYVVS